MSANSGSFYHIFVVPIIRKALSVTGMLPCLASLDSASRKEHLQALHKFVDIRHLVLFTFNQNPTQVHV